jgi:hypothetical protein
LFAVVYQRQANALHQVAVMLQVGELLGEVLKPEKRDK